MTRRWGGDAEKRLAARQARGIVAEGKGAGGLRKSQTGRLKNTSATATHTRRPGWWFRGVGRRFEERRFRTAGDLDARR